MAPPPPSSPYAGPACESALSLLWRSVLRQDVTSRACALGLIDRAAAQAASTPHGCGSLGAEIRSAREEIERDHMAQYGDVSVTGEGAWLVEDLGRDARLILMDLPGGLLEDEAG